MRTLRNIVLVILTVILLLWLFGVFSPNAQWENAIAPSDPIQTKTDLPEDWEEDGYTFTAKANYHVTAVILSKQRYVNILGSLENNLSPYDFVFGWGPMSDAEFIKEVDITQHFRWYNFTWSGDLPITGREVSSHSSNNHIIPADSNVLDQIKSVKVYDLVELDGYLVDVSREDGWKWETSLKRSDTGSGSCELFWVESVNGIDGVE